MNITFCVIFLCIAKNLVFYNLTIFAIVDESGGSAEAVHKFHTGRRSVLPCPRPPNADISVMSLLYRNIGKDLSKLSMPITMNEPLSMLQVNSLPVTLFISESIINDILYTCMHQRVSLYYYCKMTCMKSIKIFTKLMSNVSN